MSDKLRFGLFLVFLFCCWLLGRTLSFDLTSMKAWFSSFPTVFSGIIFVFLYIVSTTFIWFGPKDILRVMAALLFGGWMSTIFVYFGELGNAAILFTVSRRLGQDYVRKKFKLRNQQIEEIKTKRGIWGLLALRLNPIFPFRLLDLGTGLSQVPLKKYMLSAVIASPLRIFWIQYIIAKVGEQMMNDPYHMMQILARDHFIIAFSALYFVIVIVVSLIAGIENWLKLRKTREQVVSSS